MIENLLNDLNNEEVGVRLNALNELTKNVGIFDKPTVIKALKPLILDWDTNVRLCVAKVLELYMDR